VPGETAGDYFLYIGRLSGKRRTDACAGAAKMQETMPLKIVGDGPLGADCARVSAARSSSAI
ncbi:hypothetical protein J4734_26100, partial [Klebsiella pneumoniae]|nr:hypothetical protein [Klebsiella pneumoniae]